MNNENVIAGQTILTDDEMERLISEEKLISPFDPALLSGCSYDLRVGGKLTSRNKLSSFDLSKSDYVVESGECVTVDTLESIDLRNLAVFGVVANKHSLVATGLFHPITTIDPGFRGPLALTLFNLGNVRFTVRKGELIAKVFFTALATAPSRVYGVSQRPTHREGSTAVALFVDQPQHRDDEEELAKMYGAPIRKLYESLGEMRNNLELLDLRKGKARRERWVVWLGALVITVIGSFLTNLIRENWQSIEFWLSLYIPII